MPLVECLAVPGCGCVGFVPCYIAEEKQHKMQAALGDARISNRLGLTLVQDLTHYSGWAQFKCRSRCLCAKHCRRRSAVRWSRYTSRQALVAE